MVSSFVVVSLQKSAKFWLDCGVRLILQLPESMCSKPCLASGEHCG